MRESEREGEVGELGDWNDWSEGNEVREVAEGNEVGELGNEPSEVGELGDWSEPIEAATDHSEVDHSAHSDVDLIPIDSPRPPWTDSPIGFLAAVATSDNEDSSSDQCLGSFLLPKAIVKRIIASATQNALFSKESKDLCTAAATLFVSYLTAAALEGSGAKKTLMPEAVLQAVDACGFREMHSAMSLAYNAHKNSAAVQSTKKFKIEAECE